MSETRDHDVVVYGATGFVGKLTAAYLAEHAPEGTRVALAGRSRERLEEVRHRLGGRAVEWPVVVADSRDRAALDDMARSTRAVVTTVGPYAKYGLPLVLACAEAGTHYADLTGEVLFIREVVERADASARASGARIVNSCGFDSIPSDLGVQILHERVRADGEGELEDTTFVLTGMKGGVSGGTLASLKGQIDQLRRDPALRKVVADPYSLSPARDKEPDVQQAPDLHGPVRDEQLGGWLAPFVMASFNTRIVRRSSALQDWAYGRRFRYRELMRTGPGPVGLAKAAGVTAGLGVAVGGLTLPPTRALLDRVLPSPGEGPSEKTRARGFFRIDVHTRTSTGARYVAHVAANGDPGYAATAVMLGESGLCLALDGERLPVAAGVLTPATAMGHALADRLRAAGFTLDVERRS
ncbi:MAG TPA: saccharopine dehydrogenase NADP-binding domain-containing protein [Mycobacteriales bacterium]|nr:saccharopine dehydrogenase NADP-binding domain-containing protein [Mycobacteriales bacterium]